MARTLNYLDIYYLRQKLSNKDSLFTPSIEEVELMEDIIDSFIFHKHIEISNVPSRMYRIWKET